MRSSWYVSILTAGAGWAMFYLAEPAAGQQRAFEPPKGPTPRLANGKPDFSGVWQSPRMADVTQDMPCCKGLKELPFTPWGKQQWDSYDAAKGDYTGAVRPSAIRGRTVSHPNHRKRQIHRHALRAVGSM